MVRRDPAWRGPWEEDPHGIAAVDRHFIDDTDAQILVADPDADLLPPLQFAPVNIPPGLSFEAHGGTFP
jgi:hypothetical protein